MGPTLTALCPITLPDLFTDEFSTKSIFLLCSAAGGTVLSIQLLLLVMGGDTDGDGDGDSSDSFTLFSIRAIASFLTFFGLIGWWALEKGFGSGLATLMGFGAGLSMMLLVAWMITLQSKLAEEGNLDPDSALGKTALVYLRIPAQGEGRGKITVSVSGRTHEFQAVSRGPMLPTGIEVRVLRRVTENTFEVEALAHPE